MPTVSIPFTLTDGDGCVVTVKGPPK